MQSLASLLELNGLATTPDATSNAATVAVVDDHPVSRKLIARLLRDVDTGINVEQFSDPTQALAWLEGAAAALIVTDYRMPAMDGIQFVKAVRALEAAKQTPIMLITVLDDRDVRRRALEAGATDFLNKPIDHHECRARCRNLLDLSRRHSDALDQLSIRDAYIRKLHEESGQALNGSQLDALDITQGGRYVLMEYQALYELTSTLEAIDKLLEPWRNKRELLEAALKRPLQGGGGK